MDQLLGWNLSPSRNFARVSKPSDLLQVLGQLWYFPFCSTVWPFTEGRFWIWQQHSARVWISKFYVRMCRLKFILLLVGYIRLCREGTGVLPWRSYSEPTQHELQTVTARCVQLTNDPQTDYDSPKKSANNFRWRVQSRIYLQTIHKHKKKWDSLDKLCTMNYSSGSS